MHCNALPLARAMLYLLTSCVLDPACGLGIDLFGTRILSLAAQLRRAANSHTLADGLAKIRAARGNDGVSLFALSPEWDETFLKTSMAHSTMEAFERASHLDHAGRSADSPSSKKQKAATTLLRDVIPKRDFSLPIAARATKILGPISRHLKAQILPMMCNAARASRPGLAVGILPVLCNGMCTAQRFRMDGEEQRCRAGCRDEPGSLSHHNDCPLLHNFVIAAWRNAEVRPRRGHLFHDLITQILQRSLQDGIVVMGVIDAFVNAHNHQLRNWHNPGNF